MATRMQQRRGTASQWSGANPILNAGEIGWESDTNKFKIGDGTNHWADLTYFTDAESALAGISDLIDGAPAALDTLNELAAAINDDPTFFSTLSTSLDLKAPKANPTFTGTVTGVTKSHVGLGNVDNTSDANKPVSSATQTALDAKASLSGATFTGAVSGTSLTLSGNLTVNGTTTTVNSTAVNVNNQVIFEGATADGFETTLTTVDPTADRTVSLPDSSGTLATEDYVDNVVTTNAPNYSTLVGDGLQYVDGHLKLDNSYAGEVAMDAVAGAFNSGTGLQHNYDDASNTLTIDIDSTVATKTYADDAVGNHSSDTTSVHGISNTANLVATTDTGTVTSTMIANDTIVNADINASAAIDWTKLAVSSTVSATELGYVDGVTSSIQTQLDGKQAVVSGVSSTEIGYLDGVTSAIQTQLDNKQAIVSGVSDTEIGYLDGVTSAIQTQLNGKSATGHGHSASDVSDFTEAAQDAVGNSVGTGLTYTDSTGEIKVDTTAIQARVANVSDTEIGYLDGVTSAIQTQLNAKLALAGGTMTGALTLSGAPTSDLHAATKSYVDNVTAGINFHEAAHVATTGNLSANYSNGTSGVGATLTADTNRAWTTLDGHSSFTVGDRILVKDQTDAKQNGIYTLTTVGSVSAPWVLTRATDADNNPVGELKSGDFCLVLNGTVNAGYGYVNNSTASPIVLGTSDVTYTAFNAAKAVTAGSGLTESTPGTLDIATGGVTSAMIADGTIVNGDISASAAIAQSKISNLTSDLAAKAPAADPTFTGTVTVSASGVAFTDGTQTNEGVPSRTPIVSKTASYTLTSLTERDSLIEVSSSSGTTITIPTNSAVAYPVGTSIDILQTSTGQVTIAGDTGVTVNATPGLKLRTQWSSATLFKRATNTWVVYGDLTA